MIRPICFFTLALLVISSATVPALAESEAQNVGSPDTSGYEARLTTVRQLLRMRNLDGALSLLEVMFEQSPTDPVVINLLRNTYEESRNYAKAELLARRLIEKYPQQYSWRMYLAETEAKLGNLGAAQDAYYETFKLITPGDSGRLYDVLNSMMAFGVIDGALGLIDTLRLRSGKARAFGLQRGMILQQDRRYTDAARELLAVLAEDTTYAANDAEKYLLSMMEYPDAASEVEGVLLSVSGDVNSVRSLRLLMSHAIKAGEYDRAFAYAVRQDSLQKGLGLPLVEYVRQCLDRKAYAAAVRGTTFVLDHYTSGPFLAEISFRHAEGLARLGRYADAIAAYEKINDQFPTAADRGDALCAIGEIYMDDMNDPAKAIVYFDSVSAREPRGFSYTRALRDAPLCCIRLGDVKSAAARLEHITAQQFTEDIMEEARYRQALLRLFDHQFDSTKAALKKLMVDYPRGLYVNDAMQLVIDLDQALPETKLLTVYADALWYDLRRKPDSARTALAQLADSPDQALADVALYRLAGVELSERDTTAALATLGRLTGDFPESFYRPYGLKMKADLLITRPGQAGQAKEIYRELLEKYPNSPFVSDVRKKLRQAEEAGRIG
jgi:tetratricopeptide (TPR) repeat protein